MRNRGGELVHIIFHLAALKGRDGEIESVIMVGQDMTHLRRLENQIIEAEKMASLGKLAAGVVHELNNPLTSITVYAEYLLKKISDGKVDKSDLEKLTKILDGGKRIQKLTRDLISYGRPSSEEPEILQYNGLVTQALSFCEHTIKKHDVRIVTELAENLPMITGNRNQLLQMIINLITNACQAMKGGGELSLTTVLDNDLRLRFVVADTGMGISENDLTNIFEPFYSTKKNGEGTGLGLSIVKRIVEHHRGTIKAVSKQGEGTAVIVEFDTRQEGV